MGVKLSRTASTLICLLVFIVSCLPLTLLYALAILTVLLFLLYDHTVISAFILDVPLVVYIGRWMPSGHIVSFESIEHLSLLEIV